ncbi:MAG TPA: DinB family protein [Candidatus Baltobacterales bacterium]|nr:DinB family protein [Candidatus Baltobacterales bacterium]
MGPLAIEIFRYHKWANLELLSSCADLTDEQLQLTAPGTYGTVAGTFMHLLGAEQRYLARLGGGRPRFNEKSEFPGIAKLTAHATRTGDELIAIAERGKPDEAFETTFQDGRYTLHPNVLLVQALHHGNDHRTHICTILGSHGLAYRDMDGWSHAEATGAMKRIDKA